MKLKLMTIMMTLALGMIPFVSASTRVVEESNLSVGGAQLTVAAYRVTLNGFRVNHETFDTAFETDGKGDEVFIISEAGSIDRTASVSHRVSRKSKTYGDINGFPERVQAGSRSDKGGLKTGDCAPNRDLSQPRPAGMSTFNDDFPMLLWQGNLYSGTWSNAVVIMPTIWEWDLHSINFPVPGHPIPHDVPPEWQVGGEFDRRLGGDFGRFVSTGIRTVFRTPFLGPPRTGWAQERSMADIFNMGTNGTRVIGLRPAERVAFTDVFQPIVLIMTFDAAEQVLRGTNGMFEMTYQEPDCCGLEGSYTLFLQLERLPPVRLGP